MTIFLALLIIFIYMISKINIHSKGAEETIKHGGILQGLQGRVGSNINTIALAVSLLLTPVSYNKAEAQSIPFCATLAPAAPAALACLVVTTTQTLILTTVGAWLISQNGSDRVPPRYGIKLAPRVSPHTAPVRPPRQYFNCRIENVKHFSIEISKMYHAYSLNAACIQAIADFYGARTIECALMSSNNQGTYQKCEAQRSNETGFVLR